MYFFLSLLVGLDELQQFTNKLNVDPYIVSSTIRRVLEKLKRIIPLGDTRLLSFLGPKGFGKTCALKYLAKKYFAGDNVIYVDLAYIQDLYDDNVIPKEDQENCTLLYYTMPNFLIGSSILNIFD